MENKFNLGSRDCDETFSAHIERVAEYYHNRGYDDE